MISPVFEIQGCTAYCGHVLDILRSLPDEHVQCVVTSPPYWQLRAYGTEPQIWGGGTHV
jgi:site-specific DNA-methyltransferase (cytosine-N4-specific)